jgi:benzylsuccinate CoA-transferase BbsF subunit
LVELAQMELVVKMLGVPVLDYAINGRTQTRTGNRHPAMAPHGVYPCLGEDEWLAITVEDEEQWRGLTAALGLSEIARDTRFSSVAGRLNHQDELDEVVAARTRAEEKHVLASRLEEAGVTASPVRTHRELLDDPHLGRRGFFEEVDHPEAGRFRYQAIAGFSLAGAPGGRERAAPMFGQHNEYVLHELMGLPPAQLAKLSAKRVISDRPYKAAPTAL